MYRAFADAGGSLSEATVYLLDEFGLPGGSPGRCDTMLERDLLSLLPDPPGRLIAWDTDADDLATMCEAVEADAARAPLDLAIVGIGANGHIGLNEPGTLVTDGARRVELDERTIESAAGYGAGPPPRWGVTFGFPTLMAAREVWLIATGGHKAEILRRALEGPVAGTVPASFLRRHPGLVVLADTDAAGALADQSGTAT
jgi:glucosamine-6-phosphate deaminase